MQQRMESVRWLDRYSRMTKRLAEAVIRSCQRLPTLHVAELFGCTAMGQRALAGATSAANHTGEATKAPAQTLGDGRVRAVQGHPLCQRGAGCRHSSGAVDRRRA